MQIVSLDNLHEMSNPVFCGDGGGGIRNYFKSSVENFTQSAKR